ncbi:aminotransferase class V-fold PLP-dependent enzyme [Myxococcota bacterium]|nr:aminotransferase class V-fold PLP-dependent enzyme [Myxococcota bacterium]
MKPTWIGTIPSAGDRVTLRELTRAARGPDLYPQLEASLKDQLGVENVALRASGRDALRSVLEVAARRTGRREVVIPAYTCFSVPASAVAGGLRVRLVDVTQDGRIDPQALERLPLERAAAVVACNLFGVPDDLSQVSALTRSAGTWLVDDAAQAFGARDRMGPVGGRGDVGVLSFGRGKPLSGLGGGAIAWNGPPEGFGTPPVPEPGRTRAVARALAYDLALSPAIFAVLSRIPSIGIGETHFEVDFARGPIDPSSLCLVSANVDGALNRAKQRERVARTLAGRLTSTVDCRPILPPPGTSGVFPRLFVVAPDMPRRNAALNALERVQAGVTGMYPTSLDQLSELRPALCEVGSYPEAQKLAGCLFTLPVHGNLRGLRLRAVETILSGALGGQGPEAPELWQTATRV